MTFLISALVFVTSLGAGLRIRARRARKAVGARGRRVEQPNSAYLSPGVRRLEDLERWATIPLNTLHPVNRDEVRRLLQQANLSGADALSEKEKRFLDNIVEPNGS